MRMGGTGQDPLKHDAELVQSPVKPASHKPRGVAFTRKVPALQSTTRRPAPRAEKSTRGGYGAGDRIVVRLYASAASLKDEKWRKMDQLGKAFARHRIAELTTRYGQLPANVCALFRAAGDAWADYQWVRALAAKEEDPHIVQIAHRLAARAAAADKEAIEAAELDLKSRSALDEKARSQLNELRGALLTSGEEVQ